MTVLQTVRVFMNDPPPAPFVVFVDGDGWRFDCGNVVGWSFYFPKPCKCGHCRPTYEAVRRRALRAAGGAAVVRKWEDHR